MFGLTSTTVTFTAKETTESGVEINTVFTVKLTPEKETGWVNVSLFAVDKIQHDNSHDGTHISMIFKTSELLEIHNIRNLEMNLNKQYNLRGYKRRTINSEDIKIGLEKALLTYGAMGWQ
jgi:hypothetical protein